MVLSEAFRAFAEGTTEPVGLLATVARKLTELIGDACVVSLADADGIWLEPSAAFAPTTRMPRSCVPHSRIATVAAVPVTRCASCGRASRC